MIRIATGPIRRRHPCSRQCGSPAILVGRTWADTLDANSPRLLTGREYTLLRKSNRMSAMTGVHPLNGPPDFADNQFTFELVPHSPSQLVIELVSRAKDRTPLEWNVSRHTEGMADSVQTFGGAGTWRLIVPLVRGQRNRIAIHNGLALSNDRTLPFHIRYLRIEDAP